MHINRQGWGKVVVDKQVDSEVTGVTGVRHWPETKSDDAHILLYQNSQRHPIAIFPTCMNLIF